MPVNILQFKMNELTAAYHNNESYKVSLLGQENETTISRDSQSSLSSNGLQLHWDLGEYDPGVQYYRNDHVVNFAGLSDEESVTIIATGRYSGTTQQHPKGGIVVRDSDFPPPAIRKDVAPTNVDVTADLFIRFMSCVRTNGQTKIDLVVEHFNPYGTYNYSFDSMVIENYNGDHPSERYHLCKMIFTKAPRPSGTVNGAFPLPPFYTGILSNRYINILVFAESNVPALELSRKKGMVHLLP